MRRRPAQSRAADRAPPFRQARSRTLIGPNGAGKTTLIGAVTGFARYDGSISLGARDLSRMAPYSRAPLGIARSFQRPSSSSTI